MNEDLISNTIYIFFFYLYKSAIISDYKTAKMLPKTDQSSQTSIKSSGDTLFIYLLLKIHRSLPCLSLLLLAVLLTFVRCSYYNLITIDLR